MSELRKPKAAPPLLHPSVPERIVIGPSGVHLIQILARMADRQEARRRGEVA